MPVTLVDKVVCPKCSGEGGEPLNEDGRVSDHPCFFCGTKGYVNEATFNSYRKIAICEMIADRIVAKEEAEMPSDQNPLDMFDGDTEALANYKRNRSENIAKVVHRTLYIGTDCFMGQISEAILDIVFPITRPVIERQPKSKNKEGEVKIPF